MVGQSTSYPFIGGVAGERGGHNVNPAIDPALFTTPTETFTHYKAALSTATLGAAALVSGGIGKLIEKFNGTQYAIPVFVNT